MNVIEQVRRLDYLSQCMKSLDDAIDYYNKHDYVQNATTLRKLFGEIESEYKFLLNKLSKMEVE